MRVKQTAPAVSPAPALARGIGILNLLSGPRRNGATAAEIQQLTKIPPASFFRILSVLNASNLIAQNNLTGKYLLGPGAMLLGFTARAATPLVLLAQPVLRDIAGASHQMAELAVAAGNWQLMILETWQAERTSLKILSRPGLFFPINHLHAPGLCHIAFDRDYGLSRYLRASTRPDGKKLLGISHAVTTSLSTECERWKTLGYCWRMQSHGTARVTTPIYDPAKPGSVQGALSVVCEARDLTPVRAAQWAALLQASAKRIEAGKT
jgi:DNA-binding IclR family transcriptional regulator